MRSASGADRSVMLEELDAIIDLLEARIPGNPADPRNQRLEAALEKDLQAYFRNLELAMPDIATIYYRHVKEG